MAPTDMQASCCPGPSAVLGVESNPESRPFGYADTPPQTILPLQGDGAPSGVPLAFHIASTVNLDYRFQGQSEWVTGRAVGLSVSKGVQQSR